MNREQSQIQLAFSLETIRPNLLVYEANKWVGFTEDPKHDNYGQVVDRFQETVSGEARGGEPWCMDFVHFCLREVNIFSANFLSDVFVSRLLKSASCIEVFKHYKKNGYEIFNRPFIGAIPIWERPDREHGHTGIVYGVDYDLFYTVEGNTSNPLPNPTGAHRPEGVFQKVRNIKNPPADWNLLGFLDPWRADWRGYAGKTNCHPAV